MTKPRKLLLLGMFLLSTTYLLGCGSSGIKFYPIQDTDIQRVQKGEVAKVDGYILSDYYMNKVLEAKIEGKR